MKANYTFRLLFRVRVIKFLGFYLVDIGIKYNPQMCEEDIKMETLTTKKKNKIERDSPKPKQVHFEISSTHFAVYRLMKKEACFEWTPE